MTIATCIASKLTYQIDWDAVSAVATVAATMTALMLPWYQRRQDALERKRALGQSLLMKLIKVSSDLKQFWDHVQVMRRFSAAKGAPIDTWRAFLPVIPAPREVTFSSEELGMLINLKDDDTFNAVASLDEVHNSSREIFALYASLRADIIRAMPVENIEDGEGTSTLNMAEHGQLFSMDAQLNSLLKGLISRCERDAKTSWDATQKLSVTLNKKLGLKISLHLISKDPIASPPS